MPRSPTTPVHKQPAPLPLLVHTRLLLNRLSRPLAHLISFSIGARFVAALLCVCSAPTHSLPSAVRLMPCTLYPVHPCLHSFRPCRNVYTLQQPVLSSLACPPSLSLLNSLSKRLDRTPFPSPPLASLVLSAHHYHIAHCFIVNCIAHSWWPTCSGTLIRTLLLPLHIRTAGDCHQCLASICYPILLCRSQPSPSPRSRPAESGRAARRVDSLQPASRPPPSP